MLKKIAKIKKKICSGPPPPEQFSFLLYPKGKKSFLWGTKRKKSSSRGLKKEVLISFGPPKEVFSIWSPKGRFFPFGTPKEKNLLKGWRTGANFFFFWQCFSTCKKITQFLRCGKYQGGKI